MPALLARGQRRKHLRDTLTLVAVIPFLLAVAACSNDNASSTASQLDTQHPSQQQQQQPQQQPLATRFNADASPPDSQAAANASIQTPQPSTARAQSASPSGASAADSVVLAPPVIHTVD